MPLNWHSSTLSAQRAGKLHNAMQLHCYSNNPINFLPNCFHATNLINDVQKSFLNEVNVKRLSVINEDQGCVTFLHANELFSGLHLPRSRDSAKTTNTATWSTSPPHGQEFGVSWSDSNVFLPFLCFLQTQNTPSGGRNVYLSSPFVDYLFGF